MGNSRVDGGDALVSELRDIKKLLVLSLLLSGANQRQIAGALGIDRSVVSRMFKGGTSKVTKDSKASD